MKNIQNLGVSDYMEIARRRMWYAIIPTVVISIGTAIYVSRMPSYYRSETTIRVAARMLPEDYIGSIVRETTAEKIEFVRQQLSSRTFQGQIAQEFQSSGQAVGAITPELTVVPPNVFRLAYTSTDPATAQAVTRRVAERVIQLNDSFRKQRVAVIDQFLDEEVRKAATDLLAAEEKLREFNDRHFRGLPQLIDANTIGSLQGQLGAISAERANLVQSRDSLQRRLEEQGKLRLAAASAPPPRPTRQPTSAATPQAQALPQAKPVLSPAQQQLAVKQQELAALILRYGTDSKMPQLATTRRQIQELEQQISQEKKAAPDAEPQTSTTPPPQAASASEPTAPVDNQDLPPLPGVSSTIDWAEAAVKEELAQVDGLIAAKDQAARELTARISQYQRKLNLPPEIAHEMNNITREVNATKDRHTLLFNRKLATDLSARVELDESNETYRIVDPPNLPVNPSGPQRGRFAAFGVLGGLVAGLGLAFARELADSTLRDEDDASVELRLPVLTSIPIVGEKQRLLKRLRGSKGLLPAATSVTAYSGSGNPSMYSVKVGTNGSGLLPAGSFTFQNVDPKIRSVVTDPQTTSGEQYRLIRTTLSLMQKKREKFKTVLMASTIPNEGKTFSACCLASVLAQEPGKKVLLIDADLRTASASILLGLGPDHHGLSELLRGKVSMENALLECEELDLYFLPAGGSAKNPTELLSTPALERMIRHYEAIFDWIIIDSPPVLALADASLLLSVSDTSVLVVQADSTPRKLVQDSVKRIGSDRICGVLMNQVQRIHSTYYYSDYYKDSR